MALPCGDSPNQIADFLAQSLISASSILGLADHRRMRYRRFILQFGCQGTTKCVELRFALVIASLYIKAGLFSSCRRLPVASCHVSLPFPQCAALFVRYGLLPRGCLHAPGSVIHSPMSLYLRHRCLHLFRFRRCLRMRYRGRGWCAFHPNRLGHQVLCGLFGLCRIAGFGFLDAPCKVREHPWICYAFNFKHLILCCRWL